MVDRCRHAAADFGVVAGAGLQFGRIVQVAHIEAQRGDTQEDMLVLPKAVHVQQFVGQDERHDVVHDGDVAQERPPAGAVGELRQDVGAVDRDPGRPGGFAVGGKKFPGDQRTVDVERI